MKVLFVGQNPSKASRTPDVAFSDTRSRATLLAWLKRAGLRLSDVSFINCFDKVGDVKKSDASLDKVFCAWARAGKPIVVAVGRFAWDALSSDERFSCSFMLPHPSGRNRKLNDKKYVDDVLESFAAYLTRKGCARPVRHKRSCLQETTSPRAWLKPHITRKK